MSHDHQDVEPDVFEVLLDLEGLSLVEAGVAHASQAFTRTSRPRSDAAIHQLTGFRHDVLDEFGSLMRAARSEITDFFSRVEQGSNVDQSATIGVHHAGLHVGLTAHREHTGVVRLLTTPRVIALWRACMDISRRYWGDAELSTVVGCSIEDWESTVAVITELAVTEDAYAGTHRPGRQYSPEEQYLTLGGLEDWMRSSPDGHALLRPQPRCPHEDGAGSRRPDLSASSGHEEVERERSAGRTELLIGFDGLALLEGGLSHAPHAIFERGTPRALTATEVTGVDQESLIALCSVVYEVVAQVGGWFSCEVCTLAREPLAVEVHRGGLDVVVTAPQGRDGLLHVVTAPRVMALWWTCVDLARQLFGDRWLTAVLDCGATGWTAAVDAMSALEPTIQRSCSGRHRPGARYSEQDQRRIFGVLLGQGR